MNQFKEFLDVFKALGQQKVETYNFMDVPTISQGWVERTCSAQMRRFYSGAGKKRSC